MKKLYYYLAGRSQWAPEWYYKLPCFLVPVYCGDDTFKWFGIKIKFDDCTWGATLFIELRERRQAFIQRIKDRYYVWRAKRALQKITDQLKNLDHAVQSASEATFDFSNAAQLALNSDGLAPGETRGDNLETATDSSNPQSQEPAG